jgi:predicted HTH domain antitoxin
VAKAQIDSESAAKKALEKAAKEWRAAKKAERDARDGVAEIVVDVVRAGLMTENKASKIADIPRMTIRKMLGKS